jgi:hypothetical protein
MIKYDPAKSNLSMRGKELFMQCVFQKPLKEKNNWTV